MRYHSIRLLPSETQIDLSKLRLNIAKERLEFAEKILEIGDYKTVAEQLKNAQTFVQVIEAFLLTQY